MRQITIQTFLSLDGVMQAPGGPDEDRDGGFAEGGWTFNYWDGVMGEVMAAAMTQDYDLLLGRRTYDIFAAHWPRADDPQVTPKFNRARKYVLTHRPESLLWENSEGLGPDPVARLAEIKAGDGPDLSVSGSSELAHLLLAQGLADRLNLWVFPLTLGRGKRLWPEGAGPEGFRLAAHQASTTGVLILDYERAERAAPGSFALD